MLWCVLPFHGTLSGLLPPATGSKKAPNLEWVEIPKASGLASHPILCPITLVERIIANDPAKFEKTIRGGDGAVKHYTHIPTTTTVFESIPFWR